MNLKKLRKEYGKTQTEIAKDLGIMQNTYCNYENGVFEPSIEMLIKIADYFGVSLDYICDRKFTNKIGHIPAEKAELVQSILSLDDIQSKQVDAFIKGITCKSN